MSMLRLRMLLWNVIRMEEHGLTLDSSFNYLHWITSRTFPFFTFLTNLVVKNPLASFLFQLYFISSYELFSSSELESWLIASYRLLVPSKVHSGFIIWKFQKKRKKKNKAHPHYIIVPLNTYLHINTLTSKETHTQVWAHIYGDDWNRKQHRNLCILWVIVAKP